MTKLAIDMSSVMWTGLRSGVDPAAETVWFNNKQVKVNTADYGYENVVGFLTQTLKDFKLCPMDMILVFEGLNSKGPRLAIDPAYKLRNDKCPVEYVHFQVLSDRLKDLFRGAGAIAVSQDYAEADDTLAYLAMHTKEDLIIVSNDGDLARLYGVNRHGAKINIYAKGEVNQNPFGDFPLEFLTVYKAMVGDSSDKITGIVRFGQKSWEAFVQRFGLAGLREMRRLGELGTLDDLALEAESDKQIAQIYAGRDDYLKSFKLATLHPEWVNTRYYPLNWMPGLNVHEPADERLKPWAPKRRLVTADNWDAFVGWIIPILQADPEAALDIETSTPYESDEWLAQQGNPDGVDVIGSTLSGMSLTFGPNRRYTVYISVDHVDTPNVDKQLVGEFLHKLQAMGVTLVIHNTMFEGPVLKQEFGEMWKDLGNEGFLKNWLDTKLEASYVDENGKLGLKGLARRWFGYDQVEYAAVTTLELPLSDEMYSDHTNEEVTSAIRSMSPGRLLNVVRKELTPAVFGLNEAGEDVVVTPAVFQPVARFQLKMNQLSAEHVFNYACDDTVVTAAFHNFAKLFMQLEDTYDVYRKVEISASYLHAQSFVNGTKISLAKLAELREADAKTWQEAWSVLEAYLIENKWEGTVPPDVTGELSAATIKALASWTGQELITMVRTPSKVAALVEDLELRQAIQSHLRGDVLPLVGWVAAKFVPKPEFNPGSPKQMQKLFYETLGLTCKVFNRPTAAAKERGERQGSPKTDELAIQYGLMQLKEEWMGADEDPRTKILQALRLMKMVNTRQGLYYEPYPYLVHWKTGKIHSSHNQCATNTRRASSSSPNVQQLAKKAKIDGQDARIRELFVPHKRKAVIVSMDFAAQELRVIADYSQDGAMLACYVGSDAKDMHAFTGLGIAQRKQPNAGWTYESFMSVLHTTTHPEHKFVKSCRQLGKLTNFVSEYGAMAPKLAATLLVSEEEAQSYLDAKEEAFSQVVAWKDSVIAEALEKGYVTTKLGARRHLAAALNSSDRSESSKAERQAVNFKIQGSSAEMTKLAEGRMWEQRLEQRFDCRIIMPCHDEVVASCSIEDLEAFLPEMHACMVAPYADMKVPIESSVSFGWSFGEQIEAGSSPTGEGVKAAIAELMKGLQ